MAVNRFLVDWRHLVFGGALLFRGARSSTVNGVEGPTQISEPPNLRISADNLASPADDGAGRDGTIPGSIFTDLNDSIYQEGTLLDRVCRKAGYEPSSMRLDQRSLTNDEESTNAPTTESVASETDSTTHHIADGHNVGDHDDGAEGEGRSGEGGGEGVKGVEADPAVPLFPPSTRSPLAMLNLPLLPQTRPSASGSRRDRRDGPLGGSRIAGGTRVYHFGETMNGMGVGPTAEEFSSLTFPSKEGASNSTGLGRVWLKRLS